MDDRNGDAEAEPLYLRALAIRDQHDPSGTATAEVLNNLASLQYRQRRFAKAEPLFLILALIATVAGLWFLVSLFRD